MAQNLTSLRGTPSVPLQGVAPYFLTEDGTVRQPAYIPAVSVSRIYTAGFNTTNGTNVQLIAGVANSRIWVLAINYTIYGQAGNTAAIQFATGPALVAVIPTISTFVGAIDYRPGGFNGGAVGDALNIVGSGVTSIAIVIQYCVFAVTG